MEELFKILDVAGPASMKGGKEEVAEVLRGIPAKEIGRNHCSLPRNMKPTTTINTKHSESSTCILGTVRHHGDEGIHRSGPRLAA